MVLLAALVETVEAPELQLAAEVLQRSTGLPAPRATLQVTAVAQAAQEVPVMTTVLQARQPSASRAPFTALRQQSV